MRAGIGAEFFPRRFYLAVFAAASLVQPFAQSTAATLDWRVGSDYRYAELAVPSGGRAGFTRLLPATTGIAFTNYLSDEAIAINRILENGSGVALGDVDGDGWCDLYLCRLQGANVLYRNAGNWRFEDITAQAGVACPDQSSTGALLADIDGDYDLDLLVNSVGGGTRLFLNDGAARFTEVNESGLARRFAGMSMAMADLDADGDLELYVANYRTSTVKDGAPGLKVESKRVNGKVVITPADRFEAVVTKSGAVRMRELGEPDILYVNKGAGRFGPISWIGSAFVDEDGKPLESAPRDWGLSVMFRDMNSDGTPDLYVCNDFFYSLDRMWLNEGGQRFRANSRLAFRKMSMSSMAVDFADIDRDGHDDFFVADMLSRDHGARHRQRANTAMVREVHLPVADPDFRPEVIQNTLHLSRGDGTFAEIAHLAGVAASEWTWSAAFMDVDLDGFEDLLITNGNAHDVLDADVLRETTAPGKSAEQHLKDLKKFPRIETPNLIFRNRRDRTFAEVGSEWGFNTAGISHGMALGDLDNDGDLDVVVNNLNSAAGVYRNESSEARIAVRLRGKGANTRGVGGKIKVTGGPIAQTQEMICGGRYLSCDDAMRVFAAGVLTNRLRIEVVWRSGARSVIENVQANRIYEIDESGGRPDAVNAAPEAAKVQAWFADVSALLGHTHRDDLFDDFQRQPLLPNSLGRMGPAVCWFDTNDDGWDDLIVAAGKNGSLAVHQNDGKGGFNRLAQAPLNQTVTSDQNGVLGWKKKDGQIVLLLGSANYEDVRVSAGVRELDLNAGTIQGSAHTSGAGALAMGDLDADGDLDLFVGGSVIGGRWPEAGESRIYQWDGSQFRLDAANSGVLEKVGLVSAATWSDLDGNGFPELILACLWGPVRVLTNSSGKLSESTGELGLQNYTGWWNSVTSGDIDGDGRPDLIAGNWGLNSAYQATPDKPVRIYHGDFDGRGVIDIIEAEYDSRTGAIVPTRPLDLLGAAIPLLRDRFSSHRAFGEATVAEVLKPYRATAKEWQATTLVSMVFLNQQDRFVAAPLPFEAQLAPVFGVTVADFDGDGAEDVFLAQNFFGTQVEVPRLDAGRGVWLRNAGAGKLLAVPGQESGVIIYGEQRGAAASDFNRDGRVDLAVGQNNGATKLYLNNRAKRGLRVVLTGSAGNARAAGAQMRVLYAGGRAGPCRTIHAGSGYWSQDSAVQVLGLAESPVGLWIRWPGGKEQRIAVNKDDTEVRVAP